MSLIYYEKYLIPKEVTEIVNGKEYHHVIQGEWKCDDERVEKVWWTGSMGMGTETSIKLHLNLLTKDGNRADFSCMDGDIDMHDPQNELIRQAYEFLNTLDTQ